MTGKLDMTKTLGLTEGRFDTIFEKAQTVIHSSKSSEELLESMKKIPKNTNEAILIGSIFEKVQQQMAQLMEQEESDRASQKIYLNTVSGKKTPKGQREYKMSGVADSPAGPLEKWKSFAKERELELVLLNEVKNETKK